ncbi:MAG: system 2Fe-2S type ferredoxin [Pseudomonadota bacterium]|jgi:2Fe-2S ferredoxin
MPKITILPHDELCPNGAEFNAQSNQNLCQLLLDNGIEIEHACDMSRACTTCHVIVKQGFSSLSELDELEEDLLDRAWGLTSLSRLSCQALLGDEDLLVQIPKYTINHAKEG